MLIDIQNNPDWFYVMQLVPVSGYNYCAATALKLVYGKPLRRGFDGTVLWQAYAVNQQCTRYQVCGMYGSVMDLPNTIEAGIRGVLLHLDEFYTGTFYERDNPFRWGPLVLSQNWRIRPLLDERLWQRYVDQHR